MTYTDNMYSYLKQQGCYNHYECAGIYAITIDGAIYYIGKSCNILRRIAEHYVEIRKQNEPKYKVLAEAKRRGHTVSIHILCKIESNSEEELGSTEAEFIRQYRPVLNTQIPKEDNWRSYERQQIDVKKILSRL